MDRSGAPDDVPGADSDGAERDRAASQRDRAADTRDAAADARDRAADQRDEAADRRDEGADRRDHAGDERDESGEERDQAAVRRDRAGEALDQAEWQPTGWPGLRGSEDALHRAALARRSAAADRERASQDRRAGATERIEAEQDRTTALADRGLGASERTSAEHDREAALTDRGASARERDYSLLDDLTGTYLRGAGLMELEREVARARRTRRPLVLAFIDVDHLKDINDARGHAAGDRMLCGVANALRDSLRSYDLIIRVGGDEFICAMAGLDLPAATQRLAHLNSALETAPEPGSVTVGLAELTAAESVEALIARADAELYREREHETPPST